MSEQHPYRATIPPVPEGTPSPLWSVMIPTYNCAKYLRETLKSVLAQDPGAEVMQIEVIDDCSTKDDPQAVVEELGQGRVGFYRQPYNVGHTKNFETCLKRSRGKLIHQLHGDDYVLDGFYRKMQRAFEDNPDIGAAFCRHIFMDEHGNSQTISELEQPESGVLSNFLERIASFQQIQTPSIVVRRKVYELLGGFDSRLSWTEDWEMWVRIAARFPIWYEIEPLAVYRKHSGSNTGRYMCTAENLRDSRRAINIFQSYLPPSKANQIANKARENWALYTLYFVVPQYLTEGNTSAATAQIREALKCNHSFKVIMSLFNVLKSTAKRWFLKKIRLTM
ncbi:family 2 glycosyl transferase [Tolypothrix sp. NIES-4075]|uniref:glycosyltransferase family 2 protein n=1 Tax=Tolypothrix sp. NIES-4075 TaxID=2005459 RepID=UPI000B5C6254|nr:glycosyltransferase [Tolypothrix sp. NIES-4075]GAX42111.1 family 2 glycosyl transferase [Tolypothrix sp. NIES-4075]